MLCRPSFSTRSLSSVFICIIVYVAKIFAIEYDTPHAKKVRHFMGKLYIQTHGCQMNEYDSTKMADVLFASHQLEKTQNPEEADVLLLNTCSIRERAQEKVFSELGRFRDLKAKNPRIVIGVGGCVASQEGEAILK